MKCISSRAKGTARYHCEENVADPPSGDSASSGSSSKWPVDAEPFLHIVLVTAGLCLWYGYTHSQTEVFPFENKLIYVESKSVMLALNWTGADSNGESKKPMGHILSTT
jgi:hypothetical protein